MAEGNVFEIGNKAHDAATEALNKAIETFSLTSDVNRDLSGRTVDVGAAIAREGLQYLGDVQGAILQASDQIKEFWTRQWTLAQEFTKDPTALPQKAVALYWEEGERISRIGDAQREALSRFTGNLQNLLEKAGTETREATTKYTEKVLGLYDLKN
ncbi:MAG: hypothetical protein ACE5I0_09290 [Candidatus Binatia bacterium]